MMTQTMSWKECTEKDIITRTEPDLHRAQALKKMADTRLEFWNTKIDDRFTALKIEAYYEIIKELVLAHIYKKGYNCTNHLCLIAYLKKQFSGFDFEIQKINELRKVRNEISYRGFQVKKDYLKRNKAEFEHIIRELKKQL